MIGWFCSNDCMGIGTPLAQPYGDSWHMMPGMGGAMWMMPIFGIIFLVLVILAIIALWRYIRGGAASRSVDQGDGSLAILRERFARGEIDEEEFQARKKALGR